MPGQIGLALVAVAAGGVVVLFWQAPSAPVMLPELIHIAAGSQDYRSAGEFRQGTRVVDAPRHRLEAGALSIMKHHVSEAEYAACVEDGACVPAPSNGVAEFAQTNVNHADVTAYAA